VLENLEPAMNRSFNQQQRRRLSWRTAYRLRKRLKAGQTLSAADDYLFAELRPGDIAIDCGANVGLITELMAKQGAEVHAFEPDPSAFGVLSAKFAETANVTCHNVAVSNKTSKMKLYFREEHNADPVKFSVGSTLNPGKTDIDHELFAEVDVVPLADFLGQFPHVRMLKLDIEGAEVDVLEDLLDKRLLDRIDLTLVETHEEWIPDTIPRLNAIKKRVQQQGVRNIYFNWI
jgi:FkbM family methyltransferase